jgi:hypothetical protein
MEVVFWEGNFQIFFIFSANVEEKCFFFEISQFEVSWGV